MRRAYKLIVAMGFTTNSCMLGHYVFKRFWVTGGRRRAEDFGSLFSVSALERYTCVRSDRQQASVSRSTKRRLGFTLYVEQFVDKAKDWDKNSPYISSNNSVCTPQPQFIIIAI